jgi:hypothetical protein
VGIEAQRGEARSHGTIESDLATFKKLNLYAFTWIGLPDAWLGDLTRRARGASVMATHDIATMAASFSLALGLMLLFDPRIDSGVE